MNTEIEYTNTKQYINFVVKNFTNLFLLPKNFFWIVMECFVYAEMNIWLYMIISYVKLL